MSSELRRCKQINGLEPDCGLQLRARTVNSDQFPTTKCDDFLLVFGVWTTKVTKVYILGSVKIRQFAAHQGYTRPPVSFLIQEFLILRVRPLIRILLFHSLHLETWPCMVSLATSPLTSYMYSCDMSYPNRRGLLVNYVTVNILSVCQEFCCKSLITCEMMSTLFLVPT